MTQQTICPACGAPLEYAGEESVIRCGFCETDLSVIKENDAIRFQVLAQPEPQKEVLSQPVIPVEPEQAADAASPDVTPPDATPAGEVPIFVFGEPVREPVQKSFASQSTPQGNSVDFTGASASARPATPVEVIAPPASSSSKKWIWIVLAVVAGLCLLCALVGIAAVLILTVAASGS